MLGQDGRFATSRSKPQAKILCLGKVRTKNVLIGASTHAAACEFAVNRDRGHNGDAIPLRLRRYFRFVHVLDDYLVGRPSKPFDDFHSLFARWATSAEDLNLLFCGHDLSPRCFIRLHLCCGGNKCDIMSANTLLVKSKPLTTVRGQGLFWGQKKPLDSGLYSRV